MKQSVLLGLRERVEKTLRNMLTDMIGKFKDDGKFLGGRNTFEALEGEPDMPEKRGFKAVPSTVGEQLTWFKKYSAEYMNTVFSIEKTNAQGSTADLVVGSVSFGKYTANELLRLKSILDSSMRAMIEGLPIRTETTIWEKHNQAEFGEREIWQTPIDEGYTKTTLKRVEIVNDPHIKDSPGRPPVTQVIDTPKNTGKYTQQKYSGQITNLERAKKEVKYDALYKGVIMALEEVNSTEAVESDLGGKVLDYLFD